MKVANCTVCGTEVEPRIGPRKYCRPCGVMVVRERKRRFEEGKRRAAGIPTIDTPITCALCGAAVVRKNTAAKYCEPCATVTRKRLELEAGRRHYANSPPRIRNPEKAKASQERYRARHPDRGRARAAIYNEANRDLVNAKARARNRTDKRRAYIREWERQKALTDPAFVLNRRMKQAVRRGLLEGKNGRPWESLVGYTVDELRAHLERQFTKAMTWQNMGDWHLDHIIPKAAFHYTTADDPEFRACWSLTNLRPLWGVENYSKGAKRLRLI